MMKESNRREVNLNMKIYMTMLDELHVLVVTALLLLDYFPKFVISFCIKL